MGCSLQTGSYCSNSLTLQMSGLPRQALRREGSCWMHQLYIFLLLLFLFCLLVAWICPAAEKLSAIPLFIFAVNLLNRMSIFRENKHSLPNNFLPSVWPSFLSVQNRTRPQGWLCIPAGYCLHPWSLYYRGASLVLSLPVKGVWRERLALIPFPMCMHVHHIGQIMW